MPKIPALPPLTTPAKEDLIVVEDTSTTTTKEMTLETLLGMIYPVGSVYTNAAVATNPGTLLGFGTWVAHGSGRVNVGVDAGQTEFDTLGETGGAKTHTLTTAQIPSHAHATSSSRGNINWTGGSSSGVDHSLGLGNASGNEGGGGAHNNLQPYVTVYMWKRTA